MTTMNHNTQTIENTGVAPGSARELGNVGIARAIRNSGALQRAERNQVLRYHTWGDDLKPANEGLTAEEYEFLASVDSEGGFV